MKRILTGFTLAEILITLAIIGVVARVTLPALMSNVREQQTTTTFSKAMNTLELGNQRIFTATSSTTLTGAGVMMTLNDDKTEAEWALQPELYLSLLGTHLNGQYIKKSYTIDGVSKSNTAVFLSKDGIAYIDGTSLTSLKEARTTMKSSQGDATSTRSRNIPEKYDGKYAKIIVDLNGMDNPNKIGKDQFVFFVDNKGAVVPYGSSEYTAYMLNRKFTTTKNSETSIKNTNIVKAQWESQCNEGSSPNTVEERAACSGSIVDNGYKIIYNY